MQKALEIDPKDAETHYMLGATYVQQQKLDEAEKAFNQAIELKPDLAAAYTGLGNVYLARKNVDEGRQAPCKRRPNSSRIKPKPGWRWDRLMPLQGNKTEASKALNQCLQTQPARPAARAAARKCCNSWALPDGVVQSFCSHTTLFRT